MVHNIELGHFDSFKQLGSVVNKDTAIEQQETGRIAAGSKVFYANKRMIFNILLTRSSEMRNYKSLIRPVVSYWCYNWVLKEVVCEH